MAQFHDSEANFRLTLRFADHYSFPLPPGHKFPLAKYRLLRENLAVDERFDLQPGQPIDREALLRVHSLEYVDGFLSGTLDSKVMRRIGFPWSPELVMRTLASTGSTLLATQSALTSGFGGTLAGGTHHAFREEGSGFCVFNDLGVAIAWARAEAGIRRAAVIDLDVHQGDGTASIFRDNPEVFTLSVHGADNFPFRKQKSVLDVELPDGTGDSAYLCRLEAALEEVWQFAPELILYQAGVDSLASDRLGRLSLTMDGLRQRDNLVIGETHRRAIPLVVTIGGGYSHPIETTVEANAQTFQISAGIYLAGSAEPCDSPHPRFVPEP